MTLAAVLTPPGYHPYPFVPHWLQVVLNYRVMSNGWVTGGRIVAIVLAVLLMYFATDTRWQVGVDRRIIYGLVGLLVLLQEGNQAAFQAPFLVWRLPLLLVLEIAMLVAMERIIGGRYGRGGRFRVKRRK